VGPLTKVSLQLEWVPQAQFAGFYVAAAKGFYKAEGLEVDILPGGPSVRGLQQVASGAATFGLDSSLALYQARDTAIPIVLVAQIDQKDGFLKVTRKTSGITQPAQFKGKKVGVWPDEYEFYPLMKSVNIDPNKDITLVQQAFTMDDFINGGLDVASATMWNEYNVLLESGIKAEELNIINYSDFGFGIPHGAVMTTEAYLKDHRDIVVKFIRASIKGWKSAFEDQAGATDTVMTIVQAGTEQSTRKHQELMLAAMKTLDLPDGFDPANLGKPDPKFYETAGKIATDYKLVKNPVNVTAGYDATIWADASK
jgi:NitT/TauT family transport system substrate-binding protein